MAKHTLLILFCFLWSFISSSQEVKNPSPVFFIYDASGSMWGKVEGRTKKEIASEVLTDLIQKFPKNQQIGLVAYGHRSKSDCKDVEVLIDMKVREEIQIEHTLKQINPLGKTPLAYSAQLVIDKLKKLNIKSTIILITDGIESCDGDICKVVESAKLDHIDFKLHIVGFGLKTNESDQLICAAKAGNGEYYTASDASSLSSVLNAATSTSVDDPKSNFTIYATKNKKAIDAIARVYDIHSKKMIKSLRTYRDTGSIYLPEGRYYMEVAPLENMDISMQKIENIDIHKTENYHQDINFDGGKLKVYASNNSEGWDAIIKVINTASNKTVASGRSYGEIEVFDVDPGTYNIFIEALKIEGLDTKMTFSNIEVSSGEPVEIKHDFKSAQLLIGAKNGSNLIDALIHIKETVSEKNVANGRTYMAPTSNPKSFTLSPGTYEITVKGLGEYKDKKEVLNLTIKEKELIERIVSF